MKNKLVFLIFLFLTLSCKKKDSIPVLTDGYMTAIVNGKYIDGFVVLNRSYQSSGYMSIDGLIINKEGKYDYTKATSKEILIYVNTPSINVGKYKVGGIDYNKLGTCGYYQVDSSVTTYSPSFNHELDSGYVTVTEKNVNSITGTFYFYNRNNNIHVTEGKFKVPIY